MKKISVVVPSYNQGKFLEETLNSILDQQYPNLELFVVDGGSNDNSVDIIKKYESHINWWVSEKDKGQSDAINKGFSKATGEIVTWLCSDDLFTEGTLHKVADYFSSLPGDVGLLHGGTTLFNAEKEILSDWGYENPSVERNLAGMAFSQPSAFFLKIYLDQVGGSVNENLHYGMDYDLYCRLACVCKFYPVKDIFSRYRLHDESKSVSAQNNFIGDWNRVFINLCRQLGWLDILNELKNIGFIDRKIFEYDHPYSFIPEKNIINNADRNKILFYHLCYTLKALYWSGKISEPRGLLKILKEKYPAAWLKNEKDIPAIIKKLALPEFILRGIKKIKKMI